MAVEKFSISLPEELVASLDEIAAEDGLTRSAVIREVTTEYVSKRRSAAYEEERRRRIDGAIEGFRRLAEEWGPDERSAADIIREMRETEEGLGD
ncbi:MAG: ribbon-helix-helix protein, CopG family [Coriobacteriia bacterium]